MGLFSCSFFCTWVVSSDTRIVSSDRVNEYFLDYFFLSYFKVSATGVVTARLSSLKNNTDEHPILIKLILNPTTIHFLLSLLWSLCHSKNKSVHSRFYQLLLLLSWDYLWKSSASSSSHPLLQLTETEEDFLIWSSSELDMGKVLIQLEQPDPNKEQPIATAFRQKMSRSTQK